MPEQHCRARQKPWAAGVSQKGSGSTWTLLLPRGEAQLLHCLFLKNRTFWGASQPQRGLATELVHQLLEEKELSSIRTGWLKGQALVSVLECHHPGPSRQWGKFRANEDKQLGRGVPWRQSPEAGGDGHQILRPRRVMLSFRRHNITQISGRRLQAAGSPAAWHAGPGSGGLAQWGAAWSGLVLGAVSLGSNAGAWRAGAEAAARPGAWAHSDNPCFPHCWSHFIDRKIDWGEKPFCPKSKQVSREIRIPLRVLNRNLMTHQLPGAPLHLPSPFTLPD